MSASLFVGRVGGLAVALGVGAAMFSTGAVAGADTSDSGRRGADATDSPSPASASPASASSASPSAGTQPSARRANPGPNRGAATRSNDRAHAASSEVSAPSIAAPAAGVARRVAALAVVDPESATDSAAPEEESTSAVELPEPVGPDIRVHIDPMPDPLPEPVEAYEVTAFLSEADNGVSDGADTDPLVPSDSPAAWALLAAARREPLSRAVRTAPTAQVTSSATVTSGSLTVNPTVTIADGIIQGYLEAVSSRGLMMTYTALGATCGSNCALGDLGGKISLGTIPLLGNTEQSFTILPYANWLDGGTPGTQTFGVRVREVTDFDMFLTGIPLVGMFAAPIIDLLQTLPLIGDLLAPLIGASVVATVDVDVADLAPGNTPVAFTYRVVSFDGVDISTNFFPAAGIAAGDLAPTAISMPGLASAGQSNPYAEFGIGGQTLGVKPLRDAGYNVVTVTPRGEFDSGGILQLDSPFYEGRDVSAVVSWIASDTDAELNDDGDPKVGMVGGSYGGGIQLTAAATDPRIDAIVPDIAWNSLNSSLYPDNTFKTAYGSLLYLSLLTTGARVNSLIPRAILTGDLLGWISESAQATLASSGPTALLAQLQAPTLLTQGIVDVLFPLQQSLISAEAILGNLYNALAPGSVPAKVFWFCGGHGVCNDPVDFDAQAVRLLADGLNWLDQYVAGTGSLATAIPNFQWFDQLGGYHESPYLPYESAFNDEPDIEGIADGGLLPIIPFFGGSNGLGDLPYSLGGGAAAANAINIPVTVPVGTQVVGAPTVSFTYAGLGTTRAVYAQVVNNATGLVLGNVVTPLAVILDGRERTQTFDLSDIVYTYDPEGEGGLTVQITSSATAFENLTSFGLMNISNVSVTMPNRTTTTP
ncbi:Xaa-Pro dipeptidyl-peptidase-like domain containing protein [Mycobacteriaceae bacterium]